MKTIPTHAILLLNGDDIIDVDGRMTVSDIKLDRLEGQITYTATRPDGEAMKRWHYIEWMFDKVVKDV